MKYKRLNINNEFSKVKNILMIPTTNKIYSSQQIKLVNILFKHDIKIIWADIVPNAKYQLFIRDPLIVIRDTIILNCMKEKERQEELLGVESFLCTIKPTKKIFVPHGIVIEGGDIIPHNGILFVGQEGMRTDKAGFEFLKRNFNKTFDVIPICMQFDKNKKSWLHLDCVFNPIWDDTAIVFLDGIKEKSVNLIKAIFPNIIKITEKEKNELAANVFSLGNKTVIVQERHTRIIKELKNKGFVVETMNLYTTIAFDGYSRCMTCPIERE